MELNTKKIIEIENMTDYLEEGDYIPFININGINRSKKIHNYCNDNPFLIATIRDMDNIKPAKDILENLSMEFNIIILSINKFLNNEPLHPNIIYTTDKQLRKILNISNEMKIYIASPNRRIMKMVNMADLLSIKILNSKDYLENKTHSLFDN